MNKLFAGCLAAMALGQAVHAAEPLTPALFVDQASEAGMAETQMGKLAVQKGSTQAVRDYGQRMVDDHAKIAAQLDPRAMSKQLSTAKVLNATHQRALGALQAKSGAEFDAAYAQQMKMDHDEAVALFTRATKLPDHELSAIAAEALPMLKAHQQQAAHLHTMH